MTKIPIRPNFPVVFGMLVSENIQNWLIKKGIGSNLEKIKEIMTLTMLKCLEAGHNEAFSVATVCKRGLNWPVDSEFILLIKEAMENTTPDRIKTEVELWVTTNSITFPNQPNDTISFLMQGHRVDDAVVHVIRHKTAEAVVILPGKVEDFKNRMYLIDAEEVIVNA